MTKGVRVIVEGREYLVDVGDLQERPVLATVNNKTYQVFLPDADGSSNTESAHVVELPVRKETAGTPEEEFAGPTEISTALSNTVTAPLPGDIVEIRVDVGDSVKAGDVICVLEAMKMKNLVHASRTGVIAAVKVVIGQMVDYGAILVEYA